jgi:hypothetical protein
VNERRIRRLVFAFGLLTLALVALREAAAGDCCRQLGVGYSAGYHAPAPFVQGGTCCKLPGWLSWKSACCHPGGMLSGCGSVAAPCGPSCAPSCAPACDPCMTCGPKHPAIY